jgi:hypothetical protein
MENCKWRIANEELQMKNQHNFCPIKSTKNKKSKKSTLNSNATFYALGTILSVLAVCCVHNKNDEKSKMWKVARVKNVLFLWEYLLATNKNISCELVFVWNITKIN